MKRRLAKATALSCLAISALVLLGLIYALRGWIVEEYWIWKLDSGVKSERLEAVRALSNMKATRAIDKLLHSMVIDFREGDDKWRSREEYLCAFERMGEAAMARLIEIISTQQYYIPQPPIVVPAVHALDRIYKHPHSSKGTMNLLPWLMRIREDSSLSASTRDAANVALRFMSTDDH